MKFKDLSGQRFGKLVVVKRVGNYISPKGAKTPTWLCQCDCGNTTIVQRTSLKSGSISSCGCMRSFHGFNEYKEKEDGLYIQVKDKEVIIDKEELHKFYPYRVCIGKNGYAYTKRHQTIHRLIMDCPDGYMIDHINRNKLDNRKSNLRIVTVGENTINRKTTSNTGEPYIHLARNRYYIVEVDGKYRGVRHTLEDAIKLRDQALVGTRQKKLNYTFKS
jgi:hypothetical protein